MTISAQLTSDIRAKASFLPYCPLCSFVSVADTPDILRGPSHREVRLPASHLRPDGEVLHKIDHCCSVSRTDLSFTSKAEASQWWRVKRQEPLVCPATESRRRNTLAKLLAAQLEPYEP